MSSNYLFVDPTLLRGIARVGDFWGRLDSYNTSPTAQLADSLAWRADWQAVAQDFKNALRKSRTQESDRAQLKLFDD